MKNIFKNLTNINYLRDGYIGILLVLLLTVSLFVKVYTKNICFYLIQRKKAFVFKVNVSSSPIPFPC